jgi:transposase-like protein
MAKRRHSEEAMLRLLREAESGETVVEVCRKHGINLTCPRILIHS